MEEKSKIKKICNAFNLRRYCEQYRVGLWQCPHFLFLIMGLVIITAILATYFVAKHYAEPLVVALIATGTTVILFIISYIILNSFERAALASKEKSEFISIMSHQLRNPLSSIKWQLDLLLRKDLSPNGENGRSALLAIEEQNERMIRLINDLLEINRSESEALALRPSAFSLTDLIKETIDKYTKRAVFSNINFVFRPIQEDIEVFADKTKMGNVLNHLLDNAARYSPGEGKITIFLEKLADEARCSINDEGYGISEEDTEEIFKKFFRGKNSKKYKTEGLGVGLCLAKLIVEASGGKIGFSSTEGKGSTFWFTLPLT